MKLGIALWVIAAIGAVLLVGGCSTAPSGDMGDPMGLAISQSLKAQRNL